MSSTQAEETPQIFGLSDEARKDIQAQLQANSRNATLTNQSQSQADEDEAAPSTAVNTERTPLLTSTGLSQSERDEIEATLDANHKHTLSHSKRKITDSVGGFVTLGSLAALAGFSWYLVFRIPNVLKTLPLFAPHPVLQSFGLLVLGLGILLPQSTGPRHEKQKAKARTLHQVAQIIGATVIIVGAAFMIANKADHGAAHFTTVHGKLGLISVIFIIVQAAAGAAATWFKGAAVGGEDNGKALWKWHRLSGYILFPVLLVTVHLAGGYADWVVGGTTKTQRVWIYTVLPVLALVGVLVRIRPTKLPFLQ